MQKVGPRSKLRFPSLYLQQLTIPHVKHGLTRRPDDYRLRGADCRSGLPRRVHPLRPSTESTGAARVLEPPVREFMPPPTRLFAPSARTLSS